MEITHDLPLHLEPFRGMWALVHQYTHFGRILRVMIMDASAHSWLLSFCDCDRIAFPPDFTISSFDVSEVDLDGFRLCSIPEVGFQVRFRQCYLVDCEEMDDRFFEEQE